MRLLIARHGNTFEATDKVVWVGARTDLPLTAKGKKQAAQLALGLRELRIQPSRIICGPLKRTREHAEIVSEALGLSDKPIIDVRLKEIDYGLWEGKSSEEILEQFPAETFDSWNISGTWPENANWTPSGEVIARNIVDLAQELVETSAPDDLTLLVTSNGILKFFLKLVPGAFQSMAEKASLKVGTGKVCLLSYSSFGWEVELWNVDPARLK